MVSTRSTSYVPAPSTCPAFSFFRALPIELQIKIWEAALPGPRIIEIHAQEYNYLDRRSHIYYGMTYVTNIPIPAILHVNQESRRVGLKYYTLGFGNPRDTVNGGENTIYVDYERDTIYFNEGHEGSLFRPGQTHHTDFRKLIAPTPLFHTFHLCKPKNEEATYRKIRRLAVNLRHPDVCILHMKWFSELQELTFIAKEKDGIPDIDTTKEYPRPSKSDMRYRKALKFVDVEDPIEGEELQGEVCKMSIEDMHKLIDAHMAPSQWFRINGYDKHLDKAAIREVQPKARLQKVVRVRS